MDTFLKPASSHNLLPDRITSGWWVALGFTALVIRLPFAFDPGLTGDEINYVLIARCSAGDILSGAALDPSNPPLFMLLLHYYMKLVEENISAWKMLPLAMNLAAIVLMVRLFLRWVPTRVALFCGMLAAIHPWQVYMATELRAYALAGLLTVLILAQADRYAKSGSSAALVYWALACAACFWSHYSGAVAALVSGIYMLVVLRSRPRQILALMVAGAGSLGLMMLWLPSMMTQAINTGGGAEHLWHLAGLPLVHVLGTTFLRPEVGLFWLAAGGAAAAAAFGFTGILGFIYLLRVNRPVLMLLSGLFLATVAVPLIRSGLVGSLSFSSRYTFIANIFPILLVGCGLSLLRIPLKVAATAGILSLSLVSLGLFRWEYLGRQEVREVVTRTLIQTGDKEAWLFPNMVTAMRARFYGDGAFNVAFVSSRDPEEIGIVSRGATWLDVADSRYRSESFFDKKSRELLRSYDTVWYWARHSGDQPEDILGAAFELDRVIVPMKPGSFGAETPPVMMRFRKIQKGSQYANR
ncbi:MAG: hypothetical protein R2940_05895 [Syntrophotaleaceae bacterium]